MEKFNKIVDEKILKFQEEGYPEKLKEDGLKMKEIADAVVERAIEEIIEDGEVDLYEILDSTEDSIAFGIDEETLVDSFNVNKARRLKFYKKRNKKSYKKIVKTQYQSYEEIKETLGKITEETGIEYTCEKNRELFDIL